MLRIFIYTYINIIYIYIYIYIYIWKRNMKSFSNEALNVPLWNDWSKVTYSQVHGSLVLKALLLQSFQWISATSFAELIQFWQDPKCWRNRTFWRKNFSVSLEKDFKFYIYITRITRGRRGGGSFFENRTKELPWFWKKCFWLCPSLS